MLSLFYKPLFSYHFRYFNSKAYKLGTSFVNAFKWLISKKLICKPETCSNIYTVPIYWNKPCSMYPLCKILHMRVKWWRLVQIILIAVIIYVCRLIHFLETYYLLLFWYGSHFHSNKVIKLYKSNSRGVSIQFRFLGLYFLFCFFNFTFLLFY